MVNLSFSQDRIFVKGSEQIVYSDTGLWKNRIMQVPDKSIAIRDRFIKAVRSSPHKSLDELCDRQLQNRQSSFSPSQSLSFMERIVGIFKKIVGLFYSTSKINLDKRQIAFSAINRFDLKSTILIEDQYLRGSLRITDDSILSTTCFLSKNSPLNGLQYYAEDGQTRHIYQAISSSSDTRSPHVGNLRRISSYNDTSICYTGRVDTEKKAIEQASFIFLNELKTFGHGIEKNVDQNGNEVFTLHYVVNSLLSTNPLMTSHFKMFNNFPERDAVLQQSEILQSLLLKDPIDVFDKESDRTYRVAFKPIFFSSGLNCLEKCKATLPARLTGEDVNHQIRIRAFEHLEPFLLRKKAALQSNIQNSKTSEEGKRDFEMQLAKLDNTWNQLISLEERHMEKELITRDYLFKLLDLPSVYHCKESTDRTGIAAAMSSSLRQWLDLGLDVPHTVADLTDDIRFKELFAANLMTGHQITKYARDYEGTVDGSRRCGHSIGYKFSHGIFQNPVVLRLMPDRYLVKTSFLSLAVQAVGVFSVHLLLMPVLVLDTICALGRYLATGLSADKKPMIKDLFPYNIFTSLHRIFEWISPVQINNKSPLVKDRAFLFSAKKTCRLGLPLCPNRSSTQIPSFKEVQTSEQYGKVINWFKQNVKIKNVDCFVDEIDYLAKLDKEASLTEKEGVLESFRMDAFRSLAVDIERIDQSTNSRNIIVNGRRLCVDINTSQGNRSVRAKQIVDQLYTELLEFYLKLEDDQLKAKMRAILTIGQLHQGGMAPLLFELSKQFQSQYIFLTGNSSSYVELVFNANAIDENGNIKQPIVKKNFIIDSAHIDKMAKRQGAKYRVTPDTGLKIYDDPFLDTDAFLQASCEHETDFNRPYAISMTVL